MCEQTHLLAGKLAEHWGDVAGVLRHLLLDGLLHSRWDAARHARHDVLKLQERQGGVAHGFHQPLHPLFQLQPQNASFLKTVKAYNVLNRRTCENSSSPWRWKKAQADRSHSWCARGGPACCGKLCGASLLSEPPPGWKARLLCAARPGEEGRNTSLLLPLLLHNNNRWHLLKGQ